MAKKFIVYLIRNLVMVSHEVNCANQDQAIGIAEGLFPDARIIDIELVV